MMMMMVTKRMIITVHNYHEDDYDEKHGNYTYMHGLVIVLLANMMMMV